MSFANQTRGDGSVFTEGTYTVSTLKTTDVKDLSGVTAFTVTGGVVDFKQPVTVSGADPFAGDITVGQDLFVGSNIEAGGNILLSGNVLADGVVAGLGGSFSSIVLADNVSISVGAGAPTSDVSGGSIYLRTDGASKDEVLQVNHDGLSGSWLPLTGA